MDWDRARIAPDAVRPDRWLEPGADPRDLPLVLFGHGPAVCPGRELALLPGSALIAALIAGRELRLVRPARLGRRHPLPAALGVHRLRVSVS